MSDIVVTVPKHLWSVWLHEGGLPGETVEDDLYCFHLAQHGPIPTIRKGERVYIVSHGLLRGYAPLTGLSHTCCPFRLCLQRTLGAVAVTIPAPIRGFQGWRYCWWDRAEETPFPDWQTAGVAAPAVRNGRKSRSSLA